MKGYKEPSFQDRAAASVRAKTGALAKMKSAPKLSEADLAERAARSAEREAKAAARRAAAREARAEAERLKLEERAEAEAEKAKAAVPTRTEAELKAARDARYAARKSRK